MNHKSKIVCIIFLTGIFITLLALAVGYYFVVPRCVDFNKYENKIRSVFEKRIVYPSELGTLNIKLTWNFRARVSSDRVIIKKLNGNNFIELGPSYVEVPLLPLINNKIILKKVSINNLNADITRFEGGSFDFNTIFATVDKPTYKVSVNNTDILINGYKVDFQDNFIKPFQNYLFIGENFKVKYYSAKNKFIKIDAVGKAFLDNKPCSVFDVSFSSALPLFKSQKFHLSGTAKNLVLNTINPYIHKKLIINGKGDINFDIEVYKKYFGKNKLFIDTVLKDLKVETPEHKVISEYKGELNLFARGYYNDNLIALEKFETEAKDLNINASGTIKKNYLNLKMDFKDSQAKSIAQLVPKINDNSSFIKVIKHGVNALVSGNLKIKGNLTTPALFGKIVYKNLNFVNLPINSSKSSGNVDFIGSTIVLKNKIFLDENSFANVEGKVRPFIEKFADINVTSSDMDFDKASKVLFMAQDFFKLKLGPVNNMSFKGLGRVNLHIVGPFGDTDINGYVEPKELTVRYDTFSKPAYNVNGKLNFADKKVFYDDLTGFCQGMKIVPSGYTTLKGFSDVVINLPDLKLDKGLDFVNTSPILYKTQEALEKIQKASGNANAFIHLKGTEELLDSDGKFLFSNGNFLYNGFAAPFQNVNGILKFQNENIYFEDLSGLVFGNKATISGFINKNQDSELKIVSDLINLKDAKNFVIGSELLEKAAVVVNDYTEVDGKSSIEINLKGNLEQDPFNDMTFKNINGAFQHKLVGFPVSITGGVIKATADTVYVTDIKGNTFGYDFQANGNMSNIKAYNLKNEPMVPDFDLKFDKFDFSRFQAFAQAPLTPPEVRKFFADFDEFHGYAAVDIAVKPDEWKLNINPINVSAIYKPYDTFFLFNRGDALISKDGVNFSNLKGVVSESTFVFDGFTDKNQFDLNVNFNINSNDIAKFKFYSNIPLIANGVIPLEFSLKGNKENWNLLGQMLLEKGTYLSYLTDIGLPRDQLRRINIDIQGVKNQLDIRSLELKLADKNLLKIYGKIDNIKSQKPLFRNFIIKTNDENPLNTNVFNPSIGTVLNNGCQNFFSKGIFKADLKLNGYIESPEILGNVNFQDLMIPDYQAYIKHINIDFNRNQTKLDITNLNIGKSLMDINALMENKLESPFHINQLTINSPKLYIEELTTILPKGMGTNPSEMPPLIITNGTLNAGEMVIKNLVTNKVQANFSFTPDWRLSASKIALFSTSGTAQGNILYNLKTSELSSSFNFNRMEANVLATTMLALPNEVYGTIDGNVKFSTRGKTPQELIANSNGYTTFNARKGYFVRLGSLEYFLRAANVVRSGVGGFNLNNIIDLVSPQKTGHYETLQGSVYVKNGVIYTEDITSSGKNLSLYISGKIDMLTNESDIQVLGKLSKKVSGLLGPVGSISINQFIDYIPGLGFLPTTPDRKGVIDLIPGLGKIPGLELAGDEKDRRFVVQINGNLYEQNSVKSFRWVE